MVRQSEDGQGEDGEASSEQSGDEQSDGEQSGDRKLGDEQSDDDNSRLSDADREALLTEYQELKSDGRELSRRWNRRITRGTVVVILIVGYAAARDPLVMAVAPLPITLLLIAHVMGENSVARTYSQLARIEHRLDVDGFGYVRRMDLYSPKFETTERQIPIYAMNGFIGFVFLTTIALGLQAVATRYCVGCPETIAVGVTYLVLMVVVALLFWSNRTIYRREVREINEPVENSSDADE